MERRREAGPSRGYEPAPVDDEPRVNPLDQFTAPAELLNEYADDSYDPMAERAESHQIQSRQSDYQKRRFNRDPGPRDGADENYADAMRRANIEREEERVRRFIAVSYTHLTLPTNREV